MSASLAAAPLTGVDAVAGLAALPGASGARSPQQALRDFEALFLETLLRQAGLARAMDESSEAGGALAGDLWVHELARGLAAQLNLGLARYVNVQGDHDGQH